MIDPDSLLLSQQLSISWRLAMMREVLERNGAITGDPFRHEPLGVVEPSEITFNGGRLTVKFPNGTWYLLDDERGRVLEGRGRSVVVYHEDGRPAYASRLECGVEPLASLTGTEPRNDGRWS
jgi:hypothetical protein